MTLGVSLVTFGRRLLGLSDQSVTVRYLERSLHVHLFDDGMSIAVRPAATPGALKTVVLTGTASGDPNRPNSLHFSMGPGTPMFSTWIEAGTSGERALERLAAEITRRTPFGASARGNVLTLWKPIGER